MSKEDDYKLIQKLSDRRLILIKKFADRFLTKQKINVKIACLFRSQEKDIRLEIFKLKNALTDDLAFNEFITGIGHREFNTCIRKYCYVSAEDLNDNIKRIGLTTGQKSFGYYCDYCDLFHTTHRFIRSDTSIQPII